MEQPMESAPAPVAASGKSGKGIKIFAAVASIAAVAGIGFGVYGMMQANNASNNKDLKIEVKNSDGTTSTIEADKIEVKDGGNVAVVTEPVKTEDSKRYIYVGDWGLKIKLDDKMEFATYLNGYDTSEGYPYIMVSGAPRGGQVTPEYADFDVCTRGLGAVSAISTERYEMTKKNYEETGIIVNSFSNKSPFMTRGDLVFFYSHPQAICSKDANGESKMAEYIKNMLTNPDNYSEI